MKRTRIIGAASIGVVALGLLLVAGCSSGKTVSSNTTAVPGGAAQTTASQTATSQTVNSQSTAVSTGSDQVLPVASNPIVNTATKPGLEITAAMAENNVDPVTKKDIADRLQFTIKNTSQETLSNPEVFYQMTDSVTKKTEGYYQKLNGISLAPGAVTTVYFDSETGAGHYPENQYSIYRTSPNEVVISIELSAQGYKPAMGEAVKAVGTGENPGQ